ncbi:MAG: lycopene cyclase family protein [Gammaproteobacteria bacterium]|nr:lycopene cyclase family protein [Gammaproteobacteria bacterium]
MTTTAYDICILGAGCSGLSLAVHLIERSRRPVRMVLVEPRTAYTRDRTWCAWDVSEHRFEHLASHRWSRWCVRLAGDDSVHHSNCYRYCHIAADAFYTEALRILGAAPGCDLWLNTEAGDIGKEPDGFRVQTSRGAIRCRHVFDSRPVPPRDGTAAVLWQHFVGLRLRADGDAFDPSTVTLMDFDVPQDDGIHFFYLLPYSPREALVEATFISHGTHHPERYERAIESYLRTRFPQHSFAKLGKERGRIPMTARRPEAAGVPGVVRIGTPAGMVKPSTGYAFQAIQRSSETMVEQLNALGVIGLPSARSHVATAMDRVFLSFLQRHPDRAPQVFFDLFQNVAPDRLIRFLSDTPTAADYLSVVSAMPTLPFLKEAARLTPVLSS